MHQLKSQPFRLPAFHPPHLACMLHPASAYAASPSFSCVSLPRLPRLEPHQHLMPHTRLRESIGAAPAAIHSRASERVLGLPQRQYTHAPPREYRHATLLVADALKPAVMPTEYSVPCSLLMPTRASLYLHRPHRKHVPPPQGNQATLSCYTPKSDNHYR